MRLIIYKKRKRKEVNEIQIRKVAPMTNQIVLVRKIVTVVRTAIEDVNDEKNIVAVKPMTDILMMIQVAAAMKVDEGGSAIRKKNSKGERIRRKEHQSLKMTTTSTSFHHFSTNPTELIFLIPTYTD
jgi:hypothetical protein